MRNRIYPAVGFAKQNTQLRPVNRLFNSIRIAPFLYIMPIPVVLLMAVFNYAPMFGLLIAFEDYSPVSGILGSPWVGFDNFRAFFGSFNFVRTLRNTFEISFWDLVVSFPLTILFALLLNEINTHWFKRVVQSVSLLPYFISTVVVCSIVRDFSDTNGIFSQLIAFFTGYSGNLLGNQTFFRPLFILSNLWQNIGFGTVMYLAAMSSIDTTLYEAADLDGANRLEKAWHITIPGILSTVSVLLILRLGSLLSVNYEKILLLYRPATYDVADVIGTFTYRKGIIDADFGYSAAVGLFNSVISTTLIILSNFFVKRATGSAIF